MEALKSIAVGTVQQEARSAERSAKYGEEEYSPAEPQPQSDAVVVRLESSLKEPDDAVVLAESLKTRILERRVQALEVHELFFSGF